MVGDYIYRKGGALQVMSPRFESLKYCEEFLVVNVVVEFRRSESPGVKSDWVEFVVGGENRKDCSEGVVGGVGFDDDLGVRYPMGKNRSTSEGLLKSPKRLPTSIGEVPGYTFPSESGERNYDVGVLFYKSTIEITKAKEGLNVLNVPRLWSFQDCLNLVGRHPEALRREHIAEIFNSFGMELTLVSTSV